MTIDWQWDFETLARITNRWPESDQAASAFPIWALWTVESLDYLAQLDRDTMGPPARPQYGHGVDVIELAHTRWAAGSTITALDLCAATLAIRHAGRGADGRAAALGDFVSEHQQNANARTRAQELRAAVPESARAWVDATWADVSYHTVRRARNPLTHSRLPRLIKGSMGSASPPERVVHLPVGEGGAWMSSGDLVTMAVRVSMLHVGSFFEGLSVESFEAY